MQLEKMITEGSNTASAEIDRVSTLEMCRIINDEDKTVPLAVERVLPDIAAAIDVIHAQVSGGGRLIYLGAGTSGRLGILDASECPPTYGVKPGLVVGLIAGGEYAIQHAVEGAEDSREGGVNDLKNINLTAQDVVVGIAASGRTPYVIAGLEYARQLGCRTVGISCNPGSAVSTTAEFAITPIVGAEVVTGSSRMKAGTAQKLVLNMLSTGLMIKSGKDIADSSANPSYVAADLLSQAEHDKRARAILVTDSEALADAVESEIVRQLKLLPREAIARSSIENNGRIIITKDTNAMFELMNLVAPEHLEIAMDKSYDYLEKVENAGSVFLGHFTSEPIGDYYAGANHILPTTATSRFSSALGVHDFVKRIQYMQYDKVAVNKAKHDIITLAYAEGLQAHAKAIEVRNDNN